MDIKPPVRPPRPRETSPSKGVELPRAQKKAAPQKQPIITVPEELLGGGKKQPLLTEKTKSSSHKKRLIWAIIAVVLLLAISAISAIWWYNDALRPRSTDDHRIKLTIEQGSSPDKIAQALQDKGIIKSSLAFQILLKLSGDRDKLQAGIYLFTPTQSSKEVLQWLKEGKIDVFNITILPGQTLADIKKSLEKDGFTAGDIEAAFTKKYNHPLLASKPDDINIEGYIYPDTYQIGSETTVEQLLTHAFDTLYKRIEDGGLQPKLAARGFNLHQGITLASLIEKEVSNSVDRRQVAQVFEKRLEMDMPLGSDVTFKYAASLTGEAPSPNIDSPYNTRLYKGLPPGAVSNFTFDALEAVTDPAPGDYLYFVSGDDGTNHFSRTQEEHDANTRRYCSKLCAQ